MPDENKQEAAEAQPAAAEVEEKEALVEQMTSQWSELAVEAELTEQQRTAGEMLVAHYKEQLRGAKIDRAFFDAALEEIDRLISAQLDEVLHNEDFKKLESAWRGLKWFVDRTDFTSNIRIDLLNASKQQLFDDFKDAVGDITTTGLYQHIYSKEYGAPGGKPYGGMLFNYEFSHGELDVALLNKVAQVGNMAHAPVIGGVSPELFGPKGFEHLTDARYSVKEALAGKEYVKWNGLREDENARYVGLALPHFLLRTPYNTKDHPDPTKEFRYEEDLGGKNDNYCWGNAAFAFASRLTDSFRKYRWCWRIVGEESGGAIEDMSLHVFDEHGETIQKPPTDVAIAFRKEQELIEAGLVPLLWMKEKDFSVVYRAPSFKEPLRYPDTPEGNAKERDDKLRTKLPYIFILTRFAHYIKRLQTRYIGKPITKTQIQQELNDWIKQYVNQTTTPQPGTLGRHPLYAAEVFVEEDRRSPGVFMCDFRIRPHTMAEEFTTTLSLTTRTNLAEGQ